MAHELLAIQKCYTMSNKALTFTHGGTFMAYQITLSDQEYAALAKEAAKSGLQPEALLHEIIQRLPSSHQIKRPLTEQEFLEKQYREGKILYIPTRQPLTQEEQIRREQLAQLFSGGKPGSEMIIEDRGI